MRGLVNSKIEITDLIGETVQNASARRNQVLDVKEPLSNLFREESKGIKAACMCYLQVIPNNYKLSELIQEVVTQVAS